MHACRGVSFLDDMRDRVFVFFRLQFFIFFFKFLRVFSFIMHTALVRGLVFVFHFLFLSFAVQVQLFLTFAIQNFIFQI